MQDESRHSHPLRWLCAIGWALAVLMLILWQDAVGYPSTETSDVVADTVSVTYDTADTVDEQLEYLPAGTSAYLLIERGTNVEYVLIEGDDGSIALTPRLGADGLPIRADQA